MMHLLFGLPADFKGLVDTGRHLVEGDRELADLVIGVRDGNPLLVVAGCQGPGGRGHLLQRAQRPADDQRAQQ